MAGARTCIYRSDANSAKCPARDAVAIQVRPCAHRRERVVRHGERDPIPKSKTRRCVNKGANDGVRRNRLDALIITGHGGCWHTSPRILHRSAGRTLSGGPHRAGARRTPAAGWRIWRMDHEESHCCPPVGTARRSVMNLTDLHKWRPASPPVRVRCAAACLPSAGECYGRNRAICGDGSRWAARAWRNPAAPPIAVNNTMPPNPGSTAKRRSVVLAVRR